MSAFAFVLLMMLLARASGGGGESIHDRATQARADADKARRQADRSGHPADHHAADKAEKHADDMTRASAASKRAAATPAPWPQAVPKGLPQFPAGWQFDEPPPQAVQHRATQLLPVLWKKGAGAYRTEKTQGRWITYQAQSMGKKKGVVAFRIRPEFMPPPESPPAAAPALSV